jgi:alcohol dehydrogenase class IV
MNRARVADSSRIDRVLGWISDAFASTTPLDTLILWSRANGLPTLADMGLTPQDKALAAEAALTSSSMKANPVALDLTDLHTILAAA